MKCRLCNSTDISAFCDFGMTPLANSFWPASAPSQAEAFYPLAAFRCNACNLVQLSDTETPESIFRDYPYFSSYADGWIKHCNAFAGAAVQRFGLSARHQVIEIASNDGCLLAAFAHHGVPILGVEPAANVAQVAIAQGIPTRIGFFGSKMAVALTAEGVAADFLVANNVLAHVPDLNDFVRGLSMLLKSGGVLSIEFPSLLRLIEDNQFDTIYHEHFSYFSLLTAERALARHGLAVFDVEDLPTHGGSLRIYAQTPCAHPQAVTARVAAARRRETSAGLDTPAIYRDFDERVRAHKTELVDFLKGAKQAGRSIVAYGAPAKGNTLLNYCGIGRDIIDFTVDRNPRKQNRNLPGSHIPVRHPAAIRETRPDYVLILPWNWKDEIIADLVYIREWGGRFVIPVPKVEVIA